jgi:hypothetical protein
MQAPHRMRRTERWATGAEEWWCPTCGRRLLLHWPPNYRKLVLDPGDEAAAHTGAMVADDAGVPPPGAAVAPLAGRQRHRLGRDRRLTPARPGRTRAPR